MDAPTNKLSKYVKQKLIEPQREIDESTVIVGNFNTYLSEIDKSISHKVSKDIVKLNSNSNQDSLFFPIVLNSFPSTKQG